MAWFGIRKEVPSEHSRRFSIIRLMRRKFDENMPFTRKDERKLQTLINLSNLENDELKSDVEAKVAENARQIL